MVGPGTRTVVPDVENLFNTREEASVAAAEFIAAAITRQLDCNLPTSLVVTGGSSPSTCYAALSEKELAWDRVNVLLSDERWLPPTDDESNEKMVRSTLLVSNAAEAVLHPFYDKDSDVVSRCESFADELIELPNPFASVLLGMGEDGHIASLFTDADNFATGIDADGVQLCIPVRTAASPHMRISLTLAALLRSDQIVLLFFGDSKHAVYEKAKASATAYPVSRLLHQDRVPVHVYWAP